MTETTDYVPVNSGAAGAAKFSGSDSRKFNYYAPKGRKASHYEDMTLDVQPDPKRYLHVGRGKDEPVGARAQEDAAENLDGGARRHAAADDAELGSELFAVTRDSHGGVENGIDRRH